MNYLIEGISGTGKSAVCQELKLRGYYAIEADEVFGFYGNPVTGFKVKAKKQLNWIWNPKKVKEILCSESKDIFVCGGAMNQNKFTGYFAKVFTLYVDDETLKKRLLRRKNNDFGKNPEDLARQLEWNKGAVAYAKQRQTILIDATKSLTKVVDEILSNIVGI